MNEKLVMIRERLQFILYERISKPDFRAEAPAISDQLYGVTETLLALVEVLIETDIENAKKIIP